MNKIEAVEYIVNNPYVWPGGYATFLIMSDGESICYQCAKDNYELIRDSTNENLKDGWDAEAVDHIGNLDIEEEKYMQCAHCGKNILED